MNLSQLKFVKATAELRSFSRAAQSCHVTQPTLSNGVSQLEGELGEKIFFRTTRKVELTPFGESLLPTIASMLNLEGAIYLNAKEFSNPRTVILKIGMSPLVNAKCVTLLVNSYREHNQKHKILLIEDNLSVLSAKLKSHELDLVLVPIVDKATRKNSMRLYDEDLFLVDNTGSANSKVSVNDIRGRTFVMVPDSCGLSEITRSLLRTTRKEAREYEGKALSYQVLADWASHGLGSAILPKSKIAPNIAKQRIMRSNKPVRISFEARWLARGSKPLENLLRHFKKNIDGIVKGLAG